MNLFVERDLLGLKSTAGRMYVDGVHRWFTLEDTMREVFGQPVESWKVPKVTAIPQGQYKVTLVFSPKHQRKVPLLHGVAGFTAIEIHAGNTCVDTDGCILVGRVRENADTIRESRIAESELVAMMEDAEARGEPITITIQNAIGPTDPELGQ